jgi:hypothetical protein
MKLDKNAYYHDQLAYLRELAQRADAPESVRREALAEYGCFRAEALRNGVDVNTAIVQTAITGAANAASGMPFASRSESPSEPPYGVAPAAWSRRLDALAAEYQSGAGRLWKASQNRADAPLHREG